MNNIEKEDFKCRLKNEFDELFGRLVDLKAALEI